MHYQWKIKKNYRRRDGSNDQRTQPFHLRPNRKFSLILRCVCFWIQQPTPNLSKPNGGPSVQFPYINWWIGCVAYCLHQRHMSWFCYGPKLPIMAIIAKSTNKSHWRELAAMSLEKWSAIIICSWILSENKAHTFYTRMWCLQFLSA